MRVRKHEGLRAAAHTVHLAIVQPRGRPGPPSALRLRRAVAAVAAVECAAAGGEPPRNLDHAAQLDLAKVARLIIGARVLQHDAVEHVPIGEDGVQHLGRTARHEARRMNGALHEANVRERGRHGAHQDGAAILREPRILVARAVVRAAAGGAPEHLPAVQLVAVASEEPAARVLDPHLALARVAAEGASELARRRVTAWPQQGDGARAVAHSADRRLGAAR